MHDRKLASIVSKDILPKGKLIGTQSPKKADANNGSKKIKNKKTVK
jgi:hypothetical protein